MFVSGVTRIRSRLTCLRLHRKCKNMRLFGQIDKYWGFEEQRRAIRRARYVVFVVGERSEATLHGEALRPAEGLPAGPPVDYSGFIAVVFGITGVMFRYKLGSWLAIIFCAQSLANMRNIETDLKQISMAMMFAK